jgi:hypothetical protein
MLNCRDLGGNSQVPRVSSQTETQGFPAIPILLSQQLNVAPRAFKYHRVLTLFIALRDLFTGPATTTEIATRDRDSTLRGHVTSPTLLWQIVGFCG